MHHEWGLHDHFLKGFEFFMLAHVWGECEQLGGNMVRAQKWISFLFAAAMVLSPMGQDAEARLHRHGHRHGHQHRHYTPQVVVTQVAQSPNYVWVEGRWEQTWSGPVWREGYWMAVAPRVWVEGYWSYRRGHRVWVDGYWR